MKRIFLLVFIVAVTVVLYNCDDAGLIPEEETHEISGKVNNWSLGTKILKAVVKDSSNSNIFLADSTTIANDGSFTLKIKTPPDNFFYVYSAYNGTGCEGTITINPAGLKQASVTFNVYNDSNNAIGSIQKKSYDFVISPGSHSVSYLNFKEPGSATGSITCKRPSDTTKVTANLNSVAGWNTVVLVWNEFDPLTLHYDATIQNTEPAASLWYYVP